MRFGNAWLNGSVGLVASEWPIGDYRKVPAYPHVVRSTRRFDADLSAFNTRLLFCPMMVVLAKGTLRDVNDRNVLGAAVHLDVEGIPILTPRQLLDRLDELAALAP